MYWTGEEVVVELGPATSRPYLGVLQVGRTRDPVAAKTEAAGHRQAIANADWDTLERRAGLDVAMEKIVQWEQETPASNGRRMIDDFRLRGARSWRRMSEYATETRLFTWMVQALDNHESTLSEGGALAVVVQALPGSPHWTRAARIPRVLSGKAQCGAVLPVPRLARRGGAPHGRGRWWWERPSFFGR